MSVCGGVSGRTCEWKMLPRNVFMALFCLLLLMQNLFLLHQQLVIVLVPEALFRRNMQMERVIQSSSSIKMVERVIRSRSLRNPYVAKFDDPMTDGCQGTKDSFAWQLSFFTTSGYNFVSSRFSSQILRKESRWNAFGKSSDKKNEISLFRLDLSRASFIHWFQKGQKHLQLTQLKEVSAVMYIFEPFKLGYGSCFW